MARLPVYTVKFIFAESKALLSYRVTMRNNIRLAKENCELKQKLLDSGETALENERLRKLLHFKKKSEFTLIPARVIAKDAANWTKSLVVNQGETDGVEIGQLVIARAGVVGRIFEVSPRSSRVMLIIDPNLNIASIIEQSRQTGIVSGSLLGKCVIRYLSTDSDIKVGDRVLTLGLDGKYPKGIVIGEIVSWYKDSDGVSFSAVLRPEVDLSRLEEVLIVSAAAQR